jgi:hypothetical protein
LENIHQFQIFFFEPQKTSLSQITQQGYYFFEINAS